MVRRCLATELYWSGAGSTREPGASVEDVVAFGSSNGRGAVLCCFSRPATPSTVPVSRGAAFFWMTGGPAAGAFRTIFNLHFTPLDERAVMANNR